MVAEVEVVAKNQKARRHVLRDAIVNPEEASELGQGSALLSWFRVVDTKQSDHQCPGPRAERTTLASQLTFLVQSEAVYLGREFADPTFPQGYRYAGSTLGTSVAIISSAIETGRAVHRALGQ